jgi:hypothetical protein
MLHGHHTAGEVQVLQENTIRGRIARVCIGATALALGTVGLGGCASQGHVSSGWADGVAQGQTFTRVLVVGVSPDLDQRCTFERFLAQRIQSETTAAFTSCSSVTQREPLTRESIEEAVAAKQADAVVATILVSKEFEVEEGRSRDDRGGGMYKATGAGYAMGYYGVYGVPVVYGEFKTAPSILAMTGEVSVATKVYETRGATLVYTMDTSAKNIESKASGLDAITTPIADRLRRDGLTR